MLRGRFYPPEECDENELRELVKAGAIGALLGVLALLLGNLFIVGINQIYAVEIDEVNTPFLPVAAGRIRVVLIIVLFAIFTFGLPLGA